jgi:hypothetical protein
MIPEFLKSSKQDGSLSRTVTGLSGVLVFFIVSYTPIVEADAVSIVNSLLILISTAYSLVGLYKKYYNKTHNETI